MISSVMPDTRRFAIIGPSRCGSNMLVHALRDHPDVWFGLVEPFSVFSAARGGCRAITEDEDGVAFLEEIVFSLVPQDVRAAGFKIFYDHARKMSNSNIWNYLASDRIYVIHLTRTNALDWLISKEISALQKKYISYNSNAGLYAPDPTVLYFNMLENAITFLETEKLRIRESIPVERRLEISYEKLAGDTNKVIDDVLSFLGLPLRGLSIKTRRQCVGGQRIFVKNYDELEDEVARRRPEWLVHFSG